MDSVNAVVAVAGTLLGATATYLFQRSAVVRQERVARTERYRAERLAVYTEFAAAITDLRRAAYDRWHRFQEEPEGATFTAARDEYYRVYAVARNAQLKLRLLTGDMDLVQLAQQAVDRATDIRHADTEPECVARGGSARKALDAFVTAASTRLS